MSDVTGNTEQALDCGGVPPIPAPTPGFWPGKGDEVRADLTSMTDAAGRLKVTVQEQFGPEAGRVAETMYALLPAAPDGFVELQAFQDSHFTAQDDTLFNVQNYARGTWAFGVAAEQISRQYEGADAFASARLRDVEAAFHRVGMTVEPYESQGHL